ncbi:hypothetical protein E6O75_ATG06637 [Venturia nashicola]|uniref:Uncharacterized protein n=1 Tax=Venturia nashicola TaxID=86259 RepID=A0A4Z1NS99_9PEZI|nr:hypothetical protein E6O75_ATG06637 [Venturia nashicola]
MTKRYCFNPEPTVELGQMATKSLRGVASQLASGGPHQKTSVSESCVTCNLFPSSSETVDHFRISPKARRSRVQVGGLGVFSDHPSVSVSTCGRTEEWREMTSSGPDEEVRQRAEKSPGPLCAGQSTLAQPGEQWSRNEADAEQETARST